MDELPDPTLSAGKGLGVPVIKAVIKAGDVATRRPVLPLQNVLAVLLVNGILTAAVAVLLYGLGRGETIIAVFVAATVLQLLIVWLMARAPGLNGPVPADGPIRSLNTADASRQHALLDHVQRSSFQIYSQYSTSPRKPPRVVSTDAVLTIEPNGDTRITETMTIVATETLSMIVRKLSSDAELASVLDLGLKITVTSEPERKVVYLPASDKPRQKDLLLFLLPYATTGEEVVIKYDWRWTGYWGPLIEKRTDTYDYVSITSEPIARVQFTFRVANAIGGRLELENEGGGGGELRKPTAKDKAETDYQVATWSAENVPAMANMRIRLRLS